MTNDVKKGTDQSFFHYTEILRILHQIDIAYNIAWSETKAAPLLPGVFLHSRRRGLFVSAHDLYAFTLHARKI